MGVGMFGGGFACLSRPRAVLRSLRVLRGWFGEVREAVRMAVPDR